MADFGKARIADRSALTWFSQAGLCVDNATLLKQLISPLPLCERRNQCCHGSPISNMDVARLIAAGYDVEVLSLGEDPVEGCELNVSIEKASSSTWVFTPTKLSAECISRLMLAD